MPLPLASTTAALHHANSSQSPSTNPLRRSRAQHPGKRRDIRRHISDLGLRRLRKGGSGNAVSSLGRLPSSGAADPPPSSLRTNSLLAFLGGSAASALGIGSAGSQGLRIGSAGILSTIMGGGGGGGGAASREQSKLGFDDSGHGGHASASAPVNGWSPTFGRCLARSWRVCAPGTPGAVLVWRGMRVRIGLHSGLHNDTDLVYSKVG